MTAYRNVYRSLNNLRQYSRLTITLHENLHRNVCFETKCLWDLRFSQRCENWTGLVLKLQIYILFGCKTQFPTTPLKWHAKTKRQVWYKTGLTSSFTNFGKQQKNYWKTPQAGQTFSTQVIVFIKDSYKNELVALLCVRLCSSHSSDSNQWTAEQIFLEFDIDDFHQHLPAYSKI